MTHSKANDQLKQIASQKSMDVPSDLNPKDKAEMDRLSKLSGPAFDRAYMRFMVTDHTKDAAEFKKEANTGSDQDIKGFASNNLTTIQDHLKMAKDINAKLGTQGKTGKKASAQKPSWNPAFRLEWTGQSTRSVSTARGGQLQYAKNNFQALKPQPDFFVVTLLTTKP